MRNIYISIGLFIILMAGCGTDQSASGPDETITIKIDGDNDGLFNGAFDSTESFEITGGIITAHGRDLDGDGVIDYRDTSFSSTSKYNTIQTGDYNNDGVDDKLVMTYAPGYIYTTGYTDYNSDGTVDQGDVLINYTQVNGYHSYEEYDSTGNGVADYANSYTLTFDANGRLQSALVDLFDNSTIDKNIVISYE